MCLSGFAALQGATCQQIEEGTDEEEKQTREKEKGEGEAEAGLTCCCQPSSLVTRAQTRWSWQKECVEGVSQTCLKNVCHSNVGSQGSNLPAPLQQPYVLVDHTH